MYCIVSVSGWFLVLVFNIYFTFVKPGSNYVSNLYHCQQVLLCLASQWCMGVFSSSLQVRVLEYEGFLDALHFQ